MAGLFGNMVDLYQEKIGQPFVQGARGYLGFDPSNPQNPTEAYRAGQALGNMPGIGAPAGMFKGALQGAAMAPELIAGIMAGAKGLNAPKKMMDQAADMYKQGKSYDEIFELTGIHTQPGVPPQWEIPDNASAIINPQSFSKMPAGKGFDLSIGDVLQHDKLYANYPDLKGVKVKVVRDPKVQQGGSYDSTTDTITVTADTPENLRSVLIHELDHAVAFREEFPSGGAPEFMKTGREATIGAASYRNKVAGMAKEIQALKKAGKEVPEYMEKELRRHKFKEDLYNKLAKYPSTKEGKYQAYMDTYGELSARNAQSRIDMTPADRMEIPPAATMDIPAQEPTIWDFEKSMYENVNALPFQDTTR
jgi:hypothetical protein